MTRRTTILLFLGLCACGPEVHDRGADGGRPPMRDVSDAGPAERPDAGPDRDRGDAGQPALPDAGAPIPRLTTYADVQPFLATKCGDCHWRDAPFGTRFAADPAVLTQTTSGTNGGCADPAFDGAQMTLQECIMMTARHQWSRRTGDVCNSSPPGQYHRDGEWPCLTADEIEALEDWGASGFRR